MTKIIKKAVKKAVQKVVKKKENILRENSFRKVVINDDGTKTVITK